METMHGVILIVAALSWCLVLCGMPAGQRQKPLHYVDSCGNTEKMTKECFNGLSFHLMDFLPTTKVDLRKFNIESKCNVFNRGLECFDAIPTRCLQNQKYTWLKDNVDVARKFFKKFCSDKDFQLDYFNHKDCFTYIRACCSREFGNIRPDNLNDAKGNKNVELCCARNTYKSCMCNSARYKDSAERARETETVLSDEEHLPDCRQFEDICARAARVALNWSSIIPIASVLVAHVLSNRIRN